MEKKIYISGMHSGQNPCAGVGIARSLRKAFPNLHLVGVDHWQGSSGLHHEVVDDVLLLPQWKQIDSLRHSEYLETLLDSGNIWISGLDVETHWLAQNFGTHPNLFAPPQAALEKTAKPGVQAFCQLGFQVPESISAFLSDSEIHHFLRQNSWQCWLKGPYHEAKRTSSWDGFERSREAMKKEWKTSQLFVQKNVIGHEESICFSACRGKLTALIHMQKRLITPEGKTWAGRVNPVSRDFFEEFEDIIEQLKWTGGGEIEFVRDLDGKKWIIECNPRFPAWIFGATLSGVNLPAKMIAAACSLPFVEEIQKYPCFTRVVHEIPAKEAVGLPIPQDPSLVAWSIEGKGKGGAVQAALIPQLRQQSETTKMEESDQKIPPLYTEEIKNHLKSFEGETPTRIHLHDWTFSRFEALVTGIQKAHSHPKIQIAYSVKTSATDAHLKHAQKCGFFTECISQMEIQRALRTGVPPKEIILNGPGKFWPLTTEPVKDLHMLFCDSIEEFDRVIEIPDLARVLGFRIQLPKLQSRFGVPIDKIENFQALLKCVRRLKNRSELGFHFHMPSWAIGMQRWKEAMKSLLTWCQSIEQLTEVPIRHLDLGGGFFPSDLEKINFSWVQESVRSALPEVKVIYFEPGRSLTQEGEALVSRVLDVRKNKDEEISEIVVDACIAEMPLIHAYFHRVFFQSQTKTDEKQFQPLQKGKTKILGRICMENDVLSPGLNIPASVQLGDLVIFGDAGAYERTMSYDFGRG
ncbi:MAG: hypothetical protein ACAH59_12540 [Pseudobdellovibrionaceae bacterium]